MEKLDFVQLAVSTDEYKYMLQKVYRDTEYLVATNGHRLHYSNRLPKIETGHYIDGSTHHEFPNWKQILPTTSPIVSTELKLDKDSVKRLKLFVDLAKTIHKSETPCTLRVNHEHIEICVKSKSFESTLKLNSKLVGGQFGKISTLGFNLSYIQDALLWGFKNSPTICMTINIFNETGPIEIDVPLLGKAIIMPQRIRD